MHVTISSNMWFLRRKHNCPRWHVELPI